MRREEVKHLLGGYAAGTLTAAEQKLLFDAAMEDQSLFDALADEQSLKELLDDPEARGYLRAALEEAPVQQRAWWPKVAGVSAVAAVLTLVTVVGIRQMSTSDTKPTEVAQNSPPPQQQAKEVSTPASAPVSATAPKAAKKAAPAAASASKSVADAVEAKASDEEKREVVAVASAPPPPPPPAPARAPVPLVAAEPREKDLAKAAPETLPLTMSGRAVGAMSVQLSASQLFLTQYRQNFLPASELGGASSSQTLRGMAQRKQRAELPARQQAPEDRAVNQQRPGAPPAAASQSPSSAETATVNRGIRYQILRRNSQGQFVQTRLDTRFEVGDEIVLQVEKNAPGVVLVLAGASQVALAQQSASSAQTAPLKLTAGALDLSIVFSESPNPAASALLPQGQLTEQSGNLMYVVLPGAVPSPVVAKLRLTVYP